MSLIFCGDLLLPYDTIVDYSEVIPIFRGNTAIVNLEGCILPNKNKLNDFKWHDKYSVYSQPEVINILKDLNVKFASLCNNHILDYNYPIKYTTNLLSANNITYWGLKNYDIVQSTLNGKSLYIFTFSTCANDHSLELYKPDNIIKEITRLKQKEDCYIVIYPHWGTERLEYVEPADRQHAHRMIDAGADIIIGHHPHIIQQIETYKGKKIIYSLGNFIFPQTYYGQKKLVFKKEAIQKELLVEWDGYDVKFHMLYFNIDKNKLIVIDNIDILELSSTMGYNDYKTFYKTKVNIINYYWLRRYTDSNMGELLCYLRRRLFRLIRKTLIVLRLHHPN